MNIFYFIHPKDEVSFLTSNEPLDAAVLRMRKHKFTAIPVITKKGEYFGTVSDGDFLHFILEHGRSDGEYLRGYKVSDIVDKTKNPPAKVNSTLSAIMLQITDQNFVPVTDDRGVFIGIITRRDIIKHFNEKYNPAKTDEMNK
jgi:predicted transcriptional regulator